MTVDRISGHIIMILQAIQENLKNIYHFGLDVDRITVIVHITYAQKWLTSNVTKNCLFLIYIDIICIISIFNIYTFLAHFWRL